MTNDNSVEIQQRSFEYMNIMSSTKISDTMKRSVLNSMPVSRISQNKFNKLPIDDTGKMAEEINAEASQPKTQMKKPDQKAFEVDDIFDMTPIEPSNQANQNQQTYGGSQNMGIQDQDLFGGPLQPNNQTQALPQQNVGMVDMFGGDLLGGNQQLAQNQLPPQLQPQSKGGMFDMDLFDGSQPHPQAQSQPQSNMMNMDQFGGQPQAQPMNMNLNMNMNLAGKSPNINSPMKPPEEAYDLEFTAFSTDHLEIKFHCKKDGQKVTIKAFYNNLKPTLIGSLNVKLAAAKHLRMNLMPLNKDSVDSNSKNTTYQMIDIENTMQGKKGIALKLKLSYKITGMNVEL